MYRGFVANSEEELKYFDCKNVHIFYCPSPNKNLILSQSYDHSISHIQRIFIGAGGRRGGGSEGLFGNFGNSSSVKTVFMYVNDANINV